MFVVPRHDSLERPSLSQPTLRRFDGWLVVRDEHPAFCHGLLEVDGVQSSLAITLDGADEIPPPLQKQFDDGTMNVLVGV